MHIMNAIFVENIDECEKLWEEFSPHLSIFDGWDFRVSFWEFYKYNPYFVLLVEDNQNVGLIPLWYISDKNKYFWFGDIGDDFDWQEENSFWVKDEKYLKSLIDVCPKSTVLNNLKESACAFLAGDKRLAKTLPKQTLMMDGIYSVDDFFMTLPKKLRENLRRDKKRIESLNPEIVFDNIDDFSKLVKFNIDKFDDSPLKDERFVKTFNRIIEKGQNGEIYRSRMISVKVDGEVVGVDLNFIFKDIYLTLLCGNDTKKCPGIGHYLTMLDMQDALSLGSKLMDFSQSGEGSYKEKLFKTISQFIFIN